LDIPSWAITAIGLVAAACTTVAFVPQVVKVWRLKRADEISQSTFLLLSVGVVIWLGYGVLIDSWSLIVANGATVVLTLTILGLKFRWEHAPR
jgi:MtN3 and saliva related transmembrane protein